MAYKLQIQDEEKGFSLNVRYENLARAKRPEIVAKNDAGDQVKQTTIYQGQPIQGKTQRKWMDANGQEYAKEELKFYMDEEEVDELEQTKVFSIEGYQPLENYTDNYVIATYYEIYPDDNSMKKDIDKERAVNMNKLQMHKLWAYLISTKQVARGEFCPASRGFVASDGYIRAIKVNGTKWALEIGVFKEEKVFQHLQEGTPEKMPEAVTHKKKKVKRI